MTQMFDSFIEERENPLKADTTAQSKCVSCSINSITIHVQYHQQHINIVQYHVSYLCTSVSYLC